MNGENKIIRNLEVLTEYFIPSRIIHRDGQLKAIRDNLSLLAADARPMPRNVFIYGPTGSGKTCIAKYVAEELSSYASIAHNYINCWGAVSRFNVLYDILQKIRPGMLIHRKGMPLDEILTSLKKILETRKLVVILDEADRLSDEGVLYELLSLKNISLVLISNHENALYKFEDRIRSRLASSDIIEFPRYSVKELADILKDRSDWGLLPGVIKGAQLEAIAEFSRGDARISIGVLRKAAEEAERKDLDAITNEIIKKAIHTTTIKKPIPENLNPQQKLLLEILKEKKEAESKGLFLEFERRLLQKNLEPVVDRTFRKYMESLVKMDLASSKGKGRWRSYSVRDE